MSYTGGIKNELVVVLPESRCCRLAEIAGLLNTSGSLSEQNILMFKTENWAVARKYFTLISKTFKIEAEKNYIKKSKFSKNSVYELNVCHKDSVYNILNATGVMEEDRFSRRISGIVIRQTCCKRSYVRGAFLAGGSACTPEKGYHLEISLKTAENAAGLIKLLSSFSINAKALKRQTAVSIYIKDSEQIADFLNVCGATNALLNFENTKVLKEIRNGVNRQVNCDSANISRTVAAAAKQIKAIKHIEKTIGISSLPDILAETASVRMKNPDLRLEELGALLGIGKSGMSHRLRKIEDIAGSIEGKEVKND